MTDLKLTTIPGEHSSVNGRVVRRVVIEIDGEQKSVERVTLDSPRAIEKAAKRWEDEYGIDVQLAAEQLRVIGVEAAAESVEQRRQAKERAADPKNRVSDLADAFLASLKPEWHRNGKSMYLNCVSREVPITQLWTLATNADIDAVAKTHEAFEAGDPDFRRRLALLREAIAMAAARCIRQIPELDEATKDETVRREQIVHQIAAILLKPRTYRNDVGDSLTLNWHSWASGIEPGTGWQRCFVDPVFAQVLIDQAQPIIAISGDLLTTEMRHASKRKLATDLRSLGFADTENRVGCDAKQWRAWQIASEILDSIATILPVTDPIQALQGPIETS